jgi:TRAP-type mannitol/chloroaromatic compound transport system permease small subunit
MFLDLFPLLAMNFESLQKPEVLVLGPTSCLMGHRTQFHVRSLILHLGRELLLLQGISEVFIELLLLVVFFKYLRGGGLYFS